MIPFSSASAVADPCLFPRRKLRVWVFELAVVLCAATALAAQKKEGFPAAAFDDQGFALATPGVELVFPRDHGSHPQFKSEWWYITGHLDGPRDEAYGFQITFFRAARQDEEAPAGAAASQLYLAHAAVIDKRSGLFLHEERLNNDIWNAGAAVGELDVYNGNWYLRMTDPDTEEMVTRFSIGDFGILKLGLRPAKPKTLFGNDGYSRKGEDPSAASYYVTFPRLEVAGEMELNGNAMPVSGVAWMDHEFSSSQLSAGQVGWNWTSLILDDGSELMAYVMRREDGSVDPHSRLTLIKPEGTTTSLSPADFSWTPLRHWESSESGGVYPVEYEVSWKDDDTRRSIVVKPVSDQQEILGAIGDFVYWEGASIALDPTGKQIGLGYTELTGYADSLYGRF